MAGVMGEGIRIVGTNAIFAYEAVAGVFAEASITTTEDLDLLFDARPGIHLASPPYLFEHSLMSLLHRVDRSFEQTGTTFSAVNRDGYVVVLIKPMPDPPWAKEREQVGDAKKTDLTAVTIEGLRWLENSPIARRSSDDGTRPRRRWWPNWSRSI